MDSIDSKIYVLYLQSRLFKYAYELKFNNIEINNIYNTLRSLDNVDKEYVTMAYDLASKTVNSINPNQCMVTIRNWYLDGINSIEKLNKNIIVTNNSVKKHKYLYQKTLEKIGLIKKIFFNLENYSKTKDVKYLKNIQNLSYKHNYYVTNFLKMLGVDINDLETLDNLEYGKIVLQKNKEMNKIYKLKEKIGMSEYNTKEFLGIISSEIIEKQIVVGEEEKSVKNFTVKFKDIETGRFKTLFVNAYDKYMDKLENFKKGDTVEIKGNLKERETDKGVYLNFDMLEIEAKEIDKTLYPQYIEFSGNLGTDPLLEKTEKNGIYYFYINITIYENDREKNIGIPHYCNAIGSNANILSNFKKGDFVNVKGELNTYENKKGELVEQVLIREIKKLEKNISKNDITSKEEKKTKKIERAR